MKNFILFVHTKSHSFRLADYLKKKCLLYNIISIYPKNSLKNYNIESKSIVTLVVPLFFALLNRFIKIKNSNKIFAKVFNFFSKVQIKKNYKNKIIIGLSGYALETINYFSTKNLITVIDRACPHILEQKKLLFNELDKLPIKDKENVKRKFFDNSIVERMLKEYECCDFISVPSTFTLESFKKYNYEKKLILNQLPNEKKFFYDFKYSNKKVDELKLVAVGFNFLRKGFFYLIKAMEQIQSYNISLQLRSTIPDFLILEKIPKNINLINNHIDNKNLEKIYKEADVLILPSIDEGFGMVALEAMTLGKPVIVTKNVGMKDVLIKYVPSSEKYIAEPGDINDLCNKIINIYETRKDINNLNKNFYDASRKYLRNDIYLGYSRLINEKS